jgi:hypothetical protein
MRVQIEIPDVNVHNAIRGARMPWSNGTCGRSEFLSQTWKTSFTVHEVGDGETDVNHTVTISRINKAIKLMAQNSPEHFGYLMANRSDSETGDLLIQYACFGEIKYA